MSEFEKLCTYYTYSTYVNIIYSEKSNFVRINNVNLLKTRVISNGHITDLLIGVTVVLF